MAKVTPITEHFQHFLTDLKETFWGDLYGRTQAAWKEFLEADSREQRDRYAVREATSGGGVSDSRIGTGTTSGIS